MDEVREYRARIPYIGGPLNGAYWVQLHDGSAHYETADGHRLPIEEEPKLGRAVAWYELEHSDTAFQSVMRFVPGRQDQEPGDVSFRPPTI